MNFTATLSLPGGRTADVLEVDFQAERGFFSVKAQLWVPGSDGSAPRMIGRFRVETGKGRELGAAMQDCAVKLLREKKR